MTREHIGSIEARCLELLVVSVRMEEPAVEGGVKRLKCAEAS